jgi:uncharacterized protein (DUF736 family)
MSEQYDNTNRGALFPQEKKTDNHPNLSGSLNIAGVDYWLSGWTKTSKEGKKYISLSLGDPKEKQSMSMDSQPTTPVNDFEDDIPF